MKYVKLFVLQMLVILPVYLPAQTWTSYTNLTHYSGGHATGVDFYDNIWFSGWGGRAARINPHTMSVDIIADITNAGGMAFQDEDNYWFFVQSVGLVRYDGDSIINVYGGINSGMGLLPGRTDPLDLAFDKNGVLWVSQDDLPGTSCARWTIDLVDPEMGWETEPNILDGGWTAIESNGNIWYSDNSTGLQVFYPNYVVGPHYSSLAPQWLIDTTEVAIDRQNNKWVLGKGYMLNMCDSAGVWTYFTTNVTKIKGNGKILIDLNDNIWISHSGGISVYNRTNWIFYNTNNSGVKGSVDQIAQDSEGAFWMDVVDFGGGGQIIQRLQMPGVQGLKVTSLSLSNAENTGLSPLIEIKGTGFKGGPMKVVLKKNGYTNLYASEFNWYSWTNLTCKFDLTGIQPGMYDVMVLNPWVWPQFNYSYIVHNAFTVTAPDQPEDPSLSLDDVYIYPNSLKNDCVLDFYELPENAEISVFDRIGRFLLKKKSDGSSPFSLRICELKLPTGVYHVLITDGKKKVIRKFAVVK